MQEAQTARDARDFVKAQAYLSLALARDKGPLAIKCVLFQADLMWDDGHESAALHILEELHHSQPENVWPLFHLARKHRSKGNLMNAWKYLTKIDNQPRKDGFVWGDLLKVDLLLDNNKVEDAARLLDSLVKKYPENVPTLRKRVRVAQQLGNQETLLSALEGLLVHEPENVNLILQTTQPLANQGRHGDAIERLRAFHEANPGNIDVLVRLTELCKQAGRDEEEHAYLVKACKLDATKHSLLRYLFATKSEHLEPVLADQIFDLLTKQHGEDFAKGLKIRQSIQLFDFKNAFDLITKPPVKRRTPQQALDLINALFGTHRYKLGQRYLRFCLRRWPTDAALWLTLLQRAIKQCFSDDAVSKLEIAKADLPDRVYWSTRFYVEAYQNNLDGALECYGKLLETHNVGPHHRHIMARLIYTRHDLKDIDSLFKEVGNPGSEITRLLHRGGLTGQMTLELTMEAKALEHSGLYNTPLDWVRDRPDSTIAAIRLVDNWRATQDTASPSGDDIPTQIFQYWDAKDPPDNLADIKASWDNIPGFTHRLMHRQEAVQFLSAHFGKNWVRAFAMANNACEESDLLRLCLLAQEGGIWADADDFLYGDLGRILGHAKGLIVYREPMGGAIGNNFIAAPPQHPVIQRAAKLAQIALLRRDNENAWNKTGPGLLTRAIAQTLASAQGDASSADIQTTVLDWPIIGREIVTHIPLHYKKTSAHWQSSDRRAMNTKAVWETLLAQLETA